MGKVPKAGATATASAAGKFTPSVQKQRVIPGMAPPGAAPAATKKPSGGPAAGSADKKKTVSAPPKKEPSTPAPAPAVAAVPVDLNSAESKEKRAKGINKKLKAIQELRAKQATGQALEPEQVCVVVWCYDMFYETDRTSVAVLCRC